MSLKINRKLLERIVKEELAKHLHETALNEAPPGRGTALDDEIPDPEKAPEEPLPSDSPAPEAGDPAEEPEELPAGEEPADDALDADLEGDEEEEGTVAGDIAGKTIESISMEEESKIMPGAMEIVVTFRESPDALRLLITKTGRVKIFYKGLHNGFDSPVEQIPGEEPEMELGAEEPAGGEDLEDVAPLGPEDMPGSEEEPESEEG